MKKLFTENEKRIFIIIILLIIFYEAINHLSGIGKFIGFLWQLFLPLTLGIVFSVFLNMPVFKIKTLLDKFRIKFSLHLSIAIVFFIIALIFSIVIKFILPPLIKSIEEFSKNIPEFLENNPYIKNISFEDISKCLNTIADSLAAFFIGIVISIYLILEKKNIFNFLQKTKKALPPSKKLDIAAQYIKNSVSLFYSYFTCLISDAVIIGCFSTVAFLLLKTPYAFILGLIAATGNLIPFFGPIAATIIIAAITFMTSSPLATLWVLIVQIVLGQIDSNIIQPKIIGKSIGIRPLLVLLSVTIFGKLWGVFGMILGVPIFAILKDVISDYLNDGKINGV